MIEKLLNDYSDFKNECLKVRKPIPGFHEKFIKNLNGITFEELFNIYKKKYPIRLHISTNFIQCDGFYSISDKVIYIDNENSDNIKITAMFHEIVHYLNHDCIEKGIFDEAEAEVISYLVSKNFGIINEHSKYYVIHYWESIDFFDIYKNKIIDTAIEILEVNDGF